MTSPELLVVATAVARICLGAVFLPSAYGKLNNQQRFAQGVRDYHMLPVALIGVFARGLPWIELALAFALLTGLALPLVGLASAMLLLCFIAAVLINLRRGRTIRCHCYSLAGTDRIGWGLIVRNVLLLALTVVLIFLAPRADWLSFAIWRAEQHIWLVPSMALLTTLLIAFCLVVIPLVEWLIDLATRFAALIGRAKPKDRRL